MIFRRKPATIPENISLIWTPLYEYRRRYLHGSYRSIEVLKLPHIARLVNHKR